MQIDITKRFNFFFVFRVLGLLCLLEVPFLILSLVSGLYFKSSPTVSAFAITIAVMAVVGSLFFLLGRHYKRHSTSGRKEAMLSVSLAWLVLSLIGMLPYIISGYIPNVADAFFETMSGFTTTGATVLSDIERLPRSLLLWRSITQWQGGIGIVVLAIALLPIFGISSGGGSMIYNYEATGVLHEKFLPRAGHMAKVVAIIYVVLTLICILLFWIGPMTLFDAVCHALTCVCSGGFSTKNASLSHFNSLYIDIVAMVFMFIAGTNFSLIYFAIKGKKTKIHRDAEFKWYLSVVLIAGLLTTLWIFVKGFVPNLGSAFRYGFFQVISLITTTGYYTQNYEAWQSFFAIIALFIMFVAASTGSTSGGLKMGRFAILSINLKNEIRKRSHPSAVLPVRLEKTTIPSRFVNQVVTFFFAYVTIIIIGALILSLEGLSLTTSLSASIACVSNSGPGLDMVGPTESYAVVSSHGKFILGIIMMMGRLEIFTILTIFHSSFWKD